MRCGWPRTPRSVADWSEAVRVAVIVLDHDALRVLRVVVQRQPGEKGFVVPAEGASCMKIILPEMVVGVLLEMVTGSERTPKGGLTELLKAHEADDGSIVTVREKTGVLVALGIPSSRF